MTTANTNEDKLILGGHEFTSRFILGSGKFSLELVKACIEKAGTQIVTLALRRSAKRAPERSRRFQSVYSMPCACINMPGWIL